MVNAISKVIPRTEYPPVQFNEVSEILQPFIHKEISQRPSNYICAISQIESTKVQSSQALTHRELF